MLSPDNQSAYIELVQLVYFFGERMKEVLAQDFQQNLRRTFNLLKLSDCLIDLVAHAVFFKEPKLAQVFPAKIVVVDAQ